jgi:hypothetical protein
MNPDYSLADWVSYRGTLTRFSRAPQTVGSDYF